MQRHANRCHATRSVTTGVGRGGREQKIACLCPSVGSAAAAAAAAACAVVRKRSRVHSSKPDSAVTHKQLEDGTERQAGAKARKKEKKERQTEGKEGGGPKKERTDEGGGSRHWQPGPKQLFVHAHVVVSQALTSFQFMQLLQLLFLYGPQSAAMVQEDSRSDTNNGQS
jgi:hypothetical protein